VNLNLQTDCHPRNLAFALAPRGGMQAQSLQFVLHIPHHILKLSRRFAAIMKMLASVALILSLAGWVLTAMTGMNLLSGHFDERTCQTDCVQTFFYSAVALGMTGLLLSLLALIRSRGNVLSVLALLLALPLCGIFATLFIVGNYA
jgi:hypothetical protein